MADVHPSMERLLKAAQLATAKSRRPITDYAGVGSALGVSSAVITNWKAPARGVSKEGAIRAAAVFHCTTAWILEGRGQPQGDGRQTHSVRSFESVQSANDQPTAALSPRATSIAERLDALSGDRRDKAYALMDLALEPFETEERAHMRSAAAKRRSRNP
jgi:hypothetical protein